MFSSYILVATFMSLQRLFVIVGCNAVEESSIYSMPIRMPDVRPLENDAYFCFPMKIEPEDQEIYIVGFEPKTNMQTAHHMLLVGCSEPGSKTEDHFNCNVMRTYEGKDAATPICSKNGTSERLYLWARDAPALNLPKDVGFKVGGDSGIKYLVLEVHYASAEKFKDGSTDDSGLNILFTKVPQPKAAGIFVLNISGRLMPHTTEYWEGECELTEEIVLHPFAFRTHTHALGKVVSGYKVVSDETQSNWTLIGKKDPLLPQMFYPVENEITLTKGDSVAARCTMHNTRDVIVRYGYSSNDEMCTFYIMYWSEGSPLKKKRCISSGPPMYYWTSNRKLKNFPPDSEISSLPVGETAKEQGFSYLEF